MLKEILRVHTALMYNSLLSELERAKESQRTEFLVIAGIFGHSVSASPEELDTLYQLIGPLEEEALGFAHLLFLKEIESYQCVALSKRLKHDLFAQIRTLLKKRIVADLINHPRKPSHLDAPAINAFMPGNFSGSYPKDFYLNIFKGIIRSNDEEESPVQTDGEQLAIWIEEQYSALKERYDQPLYAIQFDEEQISLLQRMTFYELLDAKNDLDGQAFIKYWQQGGLYFFSCLCFANHEKDQNRDFWEEYKSWLGFPEDFALRGGNNVLYKPIKHFLTNQQVPHISRGRRFEYVSTFRMHAIVANRPLSRDRLPILLFKAASSDGIMLRGEGEQRIVLELLFDEYVGDALTLGEREEDNTKFYALPTETAYAYGKSKEQVLDYLLPAYSYLEKRLVGLYDSLHFDEENLSGEVPVFLRTPIDEFVARMGTSLVKELGRRQRLSRRRGVSGLYLDIESRALQYVVQDIVLPKKNERNPLVLRLRAGGKVVHTEDDLSYSTSGSYLLCHAKEIPCTQLYENLTYEFSQGNEILGAGKMLTTPIFNEEGAPVTFPTATEQGVYCLAGATDIVADELALIYDDLLDGHSLWFTYLSQATPILLNGVFYGVGKERLDRAAFLFKGEDHVDAILEIKEDRFRIISFLPNIGVRLPNTLRLEQAITVLVNGSPVSYELFQSVLLADGSDETYYTLNLKTDGANADFYSIRVDQGGTTALTERFFLLRQFGVSYGSKIYFGNEQVEVQALGFEGQENLFSRRYTFPNNLCRYKVQLAGGSEGRLVLNPPRIDVKGNGESLFGTDLWFRTFVDMETLEVEYPPTLRSLSLVVINGENTIIDRLKRIGKKWKTNHLLSRSSQDETYLTLALLIDNELTDVCAIHYELSIIEKDNGWMKFIPRQGVSIRVTGETGLILNPSFHCNPNASYTAHLNREDEKIADWPISSDGTSKYIRDHDLPGGMYTLRVVESEENPFTRMQRDTLAFTKTFLYQAYDSRSASSPRTTYHSSVVLRVRATLQMYQTDQGALYEEDIPIRNFFLEAYRDDFKKDTFTARGYFVNPSDGMKIYMGKFNPFKVKVINKNLKGLHLEIRDCDNEPLRVGLHWGLVNYLGSSFTDREIESTRFSAQLNEGDR